jgi:hypothetical protein
MSLTSILSDKNRQDLRDKFKTEFPNPGLPWKQDIICPPLTKNYGIVGTAFDYLMRFYVCYINKKLKPEPSKWVAEIALGPLSHEFSKERKLVFKDGIFQLEESPTFTFILDEIVKAKDYCNSFQKNGKITDEVLSSAIFLAKLDLNVRARIVFPDYSKIEMEDLEDLRALMKIIRRRSFKADKKVYLNPTFGAGSMIVGGADADLIIDDTLIDVKVTKFLKLDREYLNQLIGYYLLSLIGGVNNNPKDPPIKNIGIYFARYGILWTIPLKALGTKKKFEEAKVWFKDMVLSRRNLNSSLLE